MLKHLYKTLLVGVISGSLLSLNTSVVMAATDGETKTTTDNNGIITATKNYKFEKISDADMLSSLMMLSAGYITARMAIVYNKPISMDAMIAGAAGAAFIAGEITSNVKFKGKIDAMTVEVTKKNDGTVNEEQVKRLEELKTSYEEAKKTTNIKKTLQLASAAGFAAAAATAGYFAYQEAVQIKSCIAALEAMVANCSLETTSYLTAFKLVDEARQYPKPSHMSENTNPLKAPILQTPVACIPKMGVDSAVVAPQLATANGACVPTIAMLKKHQVFTYYDLKNLTTSATESANKTLFKKLIAENNENIVIPQKTFLSSLVEYIFPKAEAGWLQMLGLPAGVAAAFAISSFTLAKQIDLWIYVPFNRSIIFGLLSGIALMASKSSANVMDKLDANIAKIDSILADLNKLSSGVKAQNLTQQGISISTINPGVKSAVSFSTDGSVKSECMASNSSENCETLSSQLSSMPGFANLPDSFKNIASQTLAVGDGVSGTTGVSGSTLSAAESLGSKQNAISKALKASQDKLKKISNGKLDSDKATDKFKKAAAATMKKALESKGMTATGLMASIGATKIDSSLAPKVDDTFKKKDSGVVAGNAPAASGSDKDASMLKLDFKEAAPSESFSMGAVSSSGGKEYDIKSPEINGEFGPTLFELISGRYIKSGYPKLLEEEPTKN